MRRKTTFLFSILLCTFLCNAQYLKRDNMFYPHLDVIVANYHNCYFKFPDSVEDLIRFTEYFLKTYSNDNATKSNLEINILPYLKKNKKRISIEEEKEYTYTMRMEGDTLVYVPPGFWPFSPCESSFFIGERPNDYYYYYEKLRVPRCYSSNNRIIFFPDKVYQDFEKGIRLTQQKYIDISNGSIPYKYYIYENDTVPIFSMLEYNFGKPLRYYCSDERIVSQSPFYVNLEVFLKKFCKKHQCKQILFMLPDYNLSDNNQL